MLLSITDLHLILTYSLVIFYASFYSYTADSFVNPEVLKL